MFCKKPVPWKQHDAVPRWRTTVMLSTSRTVDFSSGDCRRSWRSRAVPAAAACASNPLHVRQKAQQGASGRTPASPARRSTHSDRVLPRALYRAWNRGAASFTSRTAMASGEIAVHIVPDLLRGQVHVQLGVGRHGPGMDPGVGASRADISTDCPWSRVSTLSSFPGWCPARLALPAEKKRVPS